MDFGRLLFSPEGRIGQRDFWIGALILTVAGILVHAIVLIGTGLWLLSTYCWVCLFAKRLHDMGRSGFLQVWLYILDVVLIGLLFALGVGTIIVGAIANHDGSAWPMLASGIGMILLALFVWASARLVFVLWLGLSTGQAGDNRYGAPPTR